MGNNFESNFWDNLDEQFPEGDSADDLDGLRRRFCPGGLPEGTKSRFLGVEGEPGTLFDLPNDEEDGY